MGSTRKHSRNYRHPANACPIVIRFSNKFWLGSAGKKSTHAVDDRIDYLLDAPSSFWWRLERIVEAGGRVSRHFAYRRARRSGFWSGICMLDCVSNFRNFPPFQTREARLGDLACGFLPAVRVDAKSFGMRTEIFGSRKACGTHPFESLFSAAGWSGGIRLAAEIAGICALYHFDENSFLFAVSIQAKCFRWN